VEVIKEYIREKIFMELLFGEKKSYPSAAPTTNVRKNTGVISAFFTVFAIDSISLTASFHPVRHVRKANCV